MKKVILACSAAVSFAADGFAEIDHIRGITGFKVIIK